MSTKKKKKTAFELAADASMLRSCRRMVRSAVADLTLMAEVLDTGGHGGPEEPRRIRKKLARALHDLDVVMWEPPTEEANEGGPAPGAETQ